MNTATLHTQIQRTRFVQHALHKFAVLLPASLRPADAEGPAEVASRDAQKVRDLAYGYSRTDPGFASDLYAAAARHEGLYAD